MAVSNRDRSYFARLGAYKNDTHSEEARDHLALSLSERLGRSWALFEVFQNAAIAPRDDSGPRAFYDRARTLGLLRR